MKNSEPVGLESDGQPADASGEVCEELIRRVSWTFLKYFIKNGGKKRF